MNSALYGQDFDLRLLLRLHARLENRRVIDVGAEKGTFAEAFLEAACPELYAFEPYPRHAEHLRRRFAATTAVRVFEVAVGARDEAAILCVAQDDTGREYDYFHALVPMPDTEQVRWHGGLAVQCRALGKRHDEFQTMQLNDPGTRSGDWGNIVFIHDRVFPALAPILHATLAEAQTALVDQALGFKRECEARLDVIDRLQRECAARLEVIHQLQSAGERPAGTRALGRRLLGGLLAGARSVQRATRRSQPPDQ